MPYRIRCCLLPTVIILSALILFYTRINVTVDNMNSPSLKNRNVHNCHFAPPKEQNTNGGWHFSNKNINRSYYAFDPGFGQSLVHFLNNCTVIDLGAGVGELGAFFKENNANISWTGFDGGNNIQEFYGKTIQLKGASKPIISKVCWINAAAPIMLKDKFDWVISIEVGEHIPKEFEPVFLDNLAFLSEEGVILSWAVKGQSGKGHVNCQPNEYIINQMQNRGLVYNKKTSLYFRQSVKRLRWLRKTIMVFKKGKISSN